jgi:hypothetical protein
MVDVSDWVEFGEGITYTYGRQTQYDDVQPGLFSFTLNNNDGRFTPDNPASPLTSKITEGMSVCWQLGTRLVHGTVLSVEIPADDARWDQLVITCDDMLGAAGRHMLTSLADGLFEHEGGQLMWRLDESEDAMSSPETNKDGLGAFTLRTSNPASTTEAVTYGIEPVVGLPGTAITVSAAPGETNWYGTAFGNQNVVSSVKLPRVTDKTKPTQLGFWNLWVYPASTINFAVTPKFATGPGYSYSMQLQATPSTYALKMGTAGTLTYTMTAAEQLIPHYLSMALVASWDGNTSTWVLFGYLYVDGVNKGAKAWYDPNNGYAVPFNQYGTATVSPVVVNVSVTNPSNGPALLSGTVQRVSFANYAGLEENALYNSLDQRRAVLDFISTEISSAPYKGPLSPATIGFPDVNGSSVLDVYNDIARSESGHLFCRTTGTLTRPVEQIQVRARDRPETPTAVFDIVTEGSGLPTFVRDITNVAAQTQVAGPTTTVTVTDPTVTGRYVTSGAGETVLYTDPEDLREWGQDRLYRGRNRAVRAQSFTVDAVTTPTDRSGDLLALVPGDRVRLSNTPVDRLGFAAWDGWLLGGSESHTFTANSFTFNFAPTLPTASVFDTDRYANDGDVTLAAAVSDIDTTFTVTSLNGTPMSTETPYTLTIGTTLEQVTVTAVSGNTLTVVRAVNGTTAYAHTPTSPIEVTTAPVYAY